MKNEKKYGQFAETINNIELCAKRLRDIELIHYVALTAEDYRQQRAFLSVLEDRANDLIEQVQHMRHQYDENYDLLGVNFPHKFKVYAGYYENYITTDHLPAPRHYQCAFDTLADAVAYCEERDDHFFLCTDVVDAMTQEDYDQFAHLSRYCKENDTTFTPIHF